MIEIHTKRIGGTIRSIPSKSYAHRALICAALADGESMVELDRSSVDIDATAKALQELGATIARTERGWRVQPGRPPAEPPVVDCVESGSTLRFLLPVAAAILDTVHFTGEGRLPERPLSPLPEQMEKNGCVFSGHILPLTIRGRLQPGRFDLPGDVSSQYISGLLLASPRLGETEIILSGPLESADYVAMTTDVMQAFGVRVDKKENGYFVPGNQQYTGRVYPVEGDWSNAAFFLAGGALSEGVNMTGLDRASKQGDRRILDALEQFGAEINWDGTIVRIIPGGRNPITLDLRQMPDALPILAVLAAGARGDSVFTGGKRLRLKESDRLQTTATMLRDLGGQVTETDEGLIVHGTGRLAGGTTSSFGDHRLAMAAAVASALCENPVRIREPEAVRKSYPDFFSDYQTIGGGDV